MKITKSECQDHFPLDDSDAGKHHQQLHNEKHELAVQNEKLKEALRTIEKHSGTDSGEIFRRNKAFEGVKDLIKE